MKIWEIMKEENIGKKYRIDSGTLFKVVKDEEAILLKTNLSDKDFTDIYNSFGIIERDFEEVIDWSKVPVDTKILVRVSEHNEWNKRHFAKFENGFIYAWDNGKTSFTSNTKVSYTAWQQAKLYEEGDE